MVKAIILINTGIIEFDTIYWFGIIASESNASPDSSSLSSPEVTVFEMVSPLNHVIV
jgi:hypothetical protein